MNLLIAAATPVLIIIIYIYIKDKYEKESKSAYSYFYKQLVRYSQLSILAFFRLVQFSIITRSAPISIKINGTFKLVRYYIEKALGKSEMKLE